jgi:hypothetical protein
MSWKILLPPSSVWKSNDLLKIKAAGSFAALVTTYKSAQPHCTLQTRSCYPIPELELQLIQ